MKKENMYEVGKIVTIKSGGPNMTIKEPSTNYQKEWLGGYECQWFAGKKLESGIFPHDSLVVVDDE
ncbi:YodC family protein [Shewanella sp.]|uniref:YodC family protein n=1 Tax=Shewanella sp. TaxID=50422 RepID=UPI004053A051